MRTTQEDRTKESMQIAARINYYKTLRHCTNKKLAGYCGISPACMINRMRNPDKFRIDELQIIASVLNVSFKTLVLGGIE